MYPAQPGGCLKQLAIDESQDDLCIGRMAMRILMIGDNDLSVVANEVSEVKQICLRDVRQGKPGNNKNFH